MRIHAYFFSVGKHVIHPTGSCITLSKHGLADPPDYLYLHLDIRLDIGLPKIESALSLLASVFHSDPHLDFRNRGNCRRLGDYLYFYLHLSLQPDQSAMVTDAYWALFGSNLGPQVAYHDQHPDRSLDLHPTY